MSRTLPLGIRPTITTRAFDPAKDSDQWLILNNLAFSEHRDQGTWNAKRLTATLREPWVDLAGFLVTEQAGKLAGFCWTKVHHTPDAPLGEIFVIATDPALQQRGLGRQLIAAGADHLACRGLQQLVLFVESDNHRALRLYQSIGFVMISIETCHRHYL